MALLRGREAVMRQFRTSLRRHGITEQQWRVLRALTTVEEIEVLALAETTVLLPPSLSRILRDLEKRQLIVRRASPDDLRRGLVSIAQRGTALIEKVGAQSETIYGEITRRFGPEKLRNLHELLARLEQVLAEPIEAGDDEQRARPRRA
jgi:homoprotocatechuate degradation regulator HpaR